MFVFRRSQWSRKLHNILYWLTVALPLLLIKFNKAAAVGICRPLDKLNGMTVMKSLGEIFTFRCPTHPCVGGTWNKAKLNETTQQLQYIEEGNSITKTITNFNDAGTYCCTSSTESCCVHITVISRPKIVFHAPTAYEYQNYTASCVINANPRMDVHLTSTQYCDFQYNTSHTGLYTTRATIRINNITSACTVITCSAKLFREHRVLKLIPPPQPSEAGTATIQTPSSNTSSSNTMDNHDTSTSTIESPPSAASVNMNSLLLTICIAIVTCTIITYF